MLAKGEQEDESIPIVVREGLSVRDVDYTPEPRYRIREKMEAVGGDPIRSQGSSGTAGKVVKTGGVLRQI